MSWGPRTMCVALLVTACARQERPLPRDAQSTQTSADAPSASAVASVAAPMRDPMCDRAQATAEKEGEPLSPKEMSDCLEGAAEMKAASEKGYQCILACMKVDSSMAAGLCSMGCIERDEALRGLAGRQRQAELGAWTALRMTPIRSHVLASDGKTKLAFEVSAPVGTIIEDPTKESDDRYLKLGELFRISILVSSFVHTQKSELRMAEVTSHAVVSQRTTPDGFVIETVSEVEVASTVLKGSGPKALRCRADIISAEAVKAQKDALLLLTKICESVKPL